MANYANDHARFAIAAMNKRKHIFSEVLPVQTMKEADERCKQFGHGGSDFYCIDHFVKKVRGDESANIIDVYEAVRKKYEENCVNGSEYQKIVFNQGTGK